MPNTATLVRAGVSGFTTGSHCQNGDAEAIMGILRTVGFAVQMLTAMEALSDGGVKMGLPRSLANQLAAHTLKGAAELVLQTGKHPVQLKDDIQTPGGASIYAMHHLERSGFRGTIADAVETATHRSKETGDLIYLRDENGGVVDPNE